jgi:hypothetical protein
VIGEREVEATDVVVVGDGCGGWKAALGEVAVPLGGRGSGFVGEVEAANQFAALPAAVGRLAAVAEQVGAVLCWRIPSPEMATGSTSSATR